MSIYVRPVVMMMIIITITIIDRLPAGQRLDIVIITIIIIIGIADGKLCRWRAANGHVLAPEWTSSQPGDDGRRWLSWYTYGNLVYNKCARRMDPCGRGVLGWRGGGDCGGGDHCDVIVSAHST